MRLWHKDLIPVLPNKQLIGQWRECCAISKNIDNNGTPNHILVNKIMNYPMEHFFVYSEMVSEELQRRGYKCNFDKFLDTFPYQYMGIISLKNEDVFKGWHNDRYLTQCYFNLQEKHDCGGMSDEEWQKIVDYVTFDGEYFHIR